METAEIVVATVVGEGIVVVVVGAAVSPTAQAGAALEHLADLSLD